MLNEKQERELAYVVIIDGIEPNEGYDRVESAIFGGWHVIVQKGQFKEVECMTEFNDGYLIICKHMDGSKGSYFVWLDDCDGWSYKEIII